MRFVYFVLFMVSARSRLEALNLKLNIPRLSLGNNGRFPRMTSFIVVLLTHVYALATSDSLPL